MRPITGKASLADRIPPHLYFVGSAVFHYLGPAFAVLLFARVAVPGVVWLRIVSAGVIFALWRKPWRAFLGGSAESRRLIVSLGVVLAVMNLLFYEAIARLPLGIVAAIEFVGPIGLAAAGSRSTRNLMALLFAGSGVFVLTDVRIEGEPLGFAFAFANAILFTLYILLAHRLSRIEDGSTAIDRLGASMLVASLAITPFGIMDTLPVLLDPVAILAGIGVGVSSSVIPYVFDQLAMRRLAQATYALFVSILPATAVLIGILILGQVPQAREVLGVALVIGGVLAHRDSPTKATVPAEAHIGE